MAVLVFLRCDHSHTMAVLGSAALLSCGTAVAMVSFAAGRDTLALATVLPAEMSCTCIQSCTVLNRRWLRDEGS